LAFFVVCAAVTDVATVTVAVIVAVAGEEGVYITWEEGVSYTTTPPTSLWEID
jgi:uncharacterized protein YsxB (DUF464 family)